MIKCEFGCGQKGRHCIESGEICCSEREELCPSFNNPDEGVSLPKTNSYYIMEEIKSLLTEICLYTGLNTAHDYDGIDTEDDILLYLRAVRELALTHLKKRGVKQEQ